MTPVPLPAASGAYTGPETGDVLDVRELAELEILALQHAASAVTQALPAVEYSGPATGEMAFPVLLRERRGTQTAVLEPITEETDVRQGWSGGRGRGGRNAGGRAARGRVPDRGDGGGRARGSRRLPAGDAPGTQAARGIAAGGAVAVLAGAGAVVARLPVSVILVAYWMLGAAVISACLASFVKGRRFTRLPVAQGRRLAIVPTYKEDEANVHGCIRSLLAQTEEIDQIVVVDDGSPDPVAPFIHPRVMWIRQENKGKRGAHCTALRQFPPGDFRFVMTVDSDSRPHADALEHLLRAMSSRKVQAATGWLYISNYAESWVARAADIDIGGSCVMMRASRSMLGALETTSGALALYRSEILYDHLDEYEVECGTGDDRWLAMRALLRGEVVGVAEAIVDTDMPVTLKGTRKQRFRWARSWWCMVPFAFARLSPRQLISPAYGLVQLAIAPVIVGWTAFAWVAGVSERLDHPGAALVFLGSYAAVRYALSALYLIGRPGMPRREKWISFLVGTPLAVLLNFFLLMPVRYQALLQVNDSRWGNR